MNSRVGDCRISGHKQLAFDMIFSHVVKEIVAFLIPPAVCGGVHCFASLPLFFRFWGMPEFKSKMAIVKNDKMWKIMKKKPNQINPPLQNNHSAYFFNF